MINLYQIHSNPETLYGYKEAMTQVPSVAWENTNHNQKKKLESLWATDAKWSYQYAHVVLNGRFPLGEAAIAKDAERSYQYARDVLVGRFPLGEAAIAKNTEYSYKYAREVLKDPDPRTWSERYRAIYRS